MTYLLLPDGRKRSTRLHDWVRREEWKLDQALTIYVLELNDWYRERCKKEIQRIREEDAARKDNAPPGS